MLWVKTLAPVWVLERGQAGWGTAIQKHGVGGACQAVSVPPSSLVGEEIAQVHHNTINRAIEEKKISRMKCTSSLPTSGIHFSAQNHRQVSKQAVDD